MDTPQTDLIDLFHNGDPFAHMSARQIATLYWETAEKGCLDLIQAMTPFVEQHRQTIRSGAADTVYLGFAYAVYENHADLVDYLWNFVGQQQHTDCVSAAGERGHAEMLQKYLRHYPLDSSSSRHRHALMDAGRYRKNHIVEQMIPYFFPMDLQQFSQDVNATPEFIDQMALHLIATAHRVLEEQAHHEQRERIAQELPQEYTPVIPSLNRKL